MRVGSVAQVHVEGFTCVSRGQRARSGVRVRAARHDRHRCAQNADHLAHNTPISAFFAEVVCTLGTTPPQAVASPPQNGGNCTTRGSDTPTTRPLKASCSAKPPPPPPARRAPEGPQGLAAAPERSEGQAAGHAGCGARGWQGLAEAGGDDTTASQMSHVIHRGHFLRFPKNVAIPTMQIRCLNESSRNYVRNCWLVAIAGHQGNAPSNTAAKAPSAWRAPEGPQGLAG